MALLDLAFAGADVRTPTGDTYVDIPTCTRGMFLVFTVDGVEQRIEMQSSWMESQRDYGFQDKAGGGWNVRRHGGSGCCG